MSWVGVVPLAGLTDNQFGAELVLVVTVNGIGFPLLAIEKLDGPSTPRARLVELAVSSAAALTVKDRGMVVTTALGPTGVTVIEPV